MRFSPRLLSPHNYKRLKDYSWTRWRRQVVQDDGIKAALEEKGIPVVDANEFVKDLNPITAIDINALPDVEPIFPKPPENNPSHPDWHEERCYSFDKTSFPVEGVKQAQVFTRSIQLRKGLPRPLLEIGNAAKIKDETQLAENAIKQAFLWDATIQKLPKLRNLEIPSHGFPAVWGIPAARSHDNVVRNLLRLCEMEFPQHSATKVITHQQDFRLGITRHGSYAQFKLPTLATVLSKNPLKPVIVDSDEVKSIPVPDIYPFNSLANFERENVYKTTDFFAFKAESPFPYVQTTFFSHDIPGSFTHIRPLWNEDRFSGATVLYCFSTAALMAKRKFGNDVKVLPSPITTQAVHLSGREFDFAVFQLNTLDLDDESPDAPKNILWLTGRQNLFESCKYNKGGAELIGYNSAVFENLLAFYGNT